MNLPANTKCAVCLKRIKSTDEWHIGWGDVMCHGPMHLACLEKHDYMKNGFGSAIFGTEHLLRVSNQVVERMNELMDRATRGLSNECC